MRCTASAVRGAAFTFSHLCRPEPGTVAGERLAREVGKEGGKRVSRMLTVGQFLERTGDSVRTQAGLPPADDHDVFAAAFGP